MIEKTKIRDISHSLGFSHCGFAKAGSLESLRPRYEAFVSRKDYSGMDYLERYTEQRLHPEMLLSGVKSVVALLMNYYPEKLIRETNNFIISKYAYCRDYQSVIKPRLMKLIEFMDHSFPESRSRPFIDSGPVLEKYWAQHCGVGWQGKHSIIINRKDGSFFFIGIILTTLELEPDEPEQDHCGSCTRCIDACPTKALHTPYQLDINRCLAFHTIVNKEEIPEEVRGKFRNNIYGCDICQDACPYNRAPKPHAEEELRPLPGLMDLRKPDWLAMQDAEFNRIFAHSEIKRTGLRTIRRNMELAGEE